MNIIGFPFKTLLEFVLVLYRYLTVMHICFPSRDFFSYFKMKRDSWPYVGSCCDSYLTNDLQPMWSQIDQTNCVKMNSVSMQVMTPAEFSIYEETEMLCTQCETHLFMQRSIRKLSKFAQKMKPNTTISVHIVDILSEKSLLNCVKSIILTIKWNGTEWMFL